MSTVRRWCARTLGLGSMLQHQWRKPFLGTHSAHFSTLKRCHVDLSSSKNATSMFFHKGSQGSIRCPVCSGECAQNMSEPILRRKHDHFSRIVDWLHWYILCGSFLFHLLPRVPIRSKPTVTWRTRAFRKESWRMNSQCSVSIRQAIAPNDPAACFKF